MTFFNNWHEKQNALIIDIMKQFLSFVKKEFYHIFRDKRTMLILLGMPIVQLDTSEFKKMDGGLTCLSLRF